MPKLKTRKSAAKRFKRTGTGKYLRNCAGKRHILTKKTRKRKNRLGKSTLTSSADIKRIIKSCPYGLK
jgi:large subunit ribosomal protein L35